jgi:histidyl-tRNA synthetase
VVFDRTLIRGQGYYTGTVFEIAQPGYPGAIAGGGRYDHLVGKFIGEQVPAVGFSIGFERIFGILQEKGAGAMENARPRLAVIYEGAFAPAYKMAEGIRDVYDCTLFVKPKKVGKLLSSLEKSGYNGFVYAENPEDIRLFGVEK